MIRWAESDWSVGEAEAVQTEPVSLASVKAHLRISDDLEDTTLEALVAAVRGTLERQYGLSLVTRDWLLKLDRFPTGDTPIRIPIGPVLALKSVRYRDEESNWTELAGCQCDLAAHPAVSRLGPPIDTDWPETDGGLAAVEVTVQAGWSADIDNPLPANVIHGILLMVGQLYAHREPVIAGTTPVPVPMTVDWIMGPLRTEWKFGNTL